MLSTIFNMLRIFFSSGRNNLVVEVLGGGGGGVMVVCPIMSRVALEGAECKVF